jgi:hypothetical protein
MKYFDAHLHLPSPDESGLSALVRHIENEPHMLGGNLILNTPQEVEFTYENFRYLPPKLNLVPYFDPSIDFPEEFTRSGWYKIHPRINRITRDQISMLMDSILAVTPRPRGIMVHCYPWGPELQFNISLPLVIELAQAAPEMQVLVAHGGGYESWAFRAHTGMLRNVYYDFSVTMSYYQGSDVLQPFKRYLCHSSERIVFGSDWPSASPAEQLLESERLALETGVSLVELEEIFLSNSRRLWPDSFA